MNYRTRWKSKLGAALQVIPTCALAASYHSEPNPVGEQVYSAHLMRRMLPVGIIVCALLLAWLVTWIRRRGAKLKTQGNKSSDYVLAFDGDAWLRDRIPAFSIGLNGRWRVLC